jgi:hypothetical protein
MEFGELKTKQGLPFPDCFTIIFLDSKSSFLLFCRIKGSEVNMESS